MLAHIDLRGSRRSLSTSLPEKSLDSGVEAMILSEAMGSAARSNETLAVHNSVVDNTDVRGI